MNCYLSDSFTRFCWDYHYLLLRLHLTVVLVRVTAGLCGDGGDEASSLGIIHCGPPDGVVVVDDVPLSGDGRSHRTIE